MDSAAWLVDYLMEIRYFCCLLACIELQQGARVTECNRVETTPCTPFSQSLCREKGCAIKLLAAHTFATVIIRCNAVIYRIHGLRVAGWLSAR